MQLIILIWYIILNEAFDDQRSDPSRKLRTTRDTEQSDNQLIYSHLHNCNEHLKIQPPFFVYNFLSSLFCNRLTRTNSSWSLFKIAPRRCTVLVGGLFRGGWQREFIFQVHTRWILVGCGDHDYGGIWWYEVQLTLHIYFNSKIT